jgi:hypothetical protein
LVSNTLVFERLGYFAAYPQSVAAFEKISAEAGYDVSGACSLWLRDGAFMHTDNHPTIRVLGLFARQALAKFGLELVDVQETGERPIDDLENSVRWPVYPALARRLGIDGSLTFSKPRFDVPSEQDRAMSLPEFVAASYAAYAETPPSPGGKTAEVVEALHGLLGMKGSGLGVTP